MRELWGSPALWNVKKSYVEIAKKLGVDEETVRNRVKYLKESGFLLGWRLVPNPLLLGRSPAFLFLELEDQDSKEEAISQLSTMDGVLVITIIYGKSLLISLFDDESGSSVKKIMDMGIRAQSLNTPGMNFPRPMQFKMTVTDWKIVKLLLKNAEKDLSEVAAGIKVSTKTVRRRLNEMLATRAVSIMPLVNLKKAGGVSYHLMIQSEDGKRSDVDAVVASKIDNLVFRATAANNGLIFGFNGTNVAEGTEILRRVKKLPGVKSARMNIVEHVVHTSDWLEREVSERARAE
jgi:DNA-binding Lrp family transcriptional regulator